MSVADTAFEVISRCRAMSISSFVGGGRSGSGSTETISTLYHFLELRGVYSWVVYM